ncbi:methyltransferase domain-containing protein [Parablautia muri]|uniref:Class I SAM-dependent methyltransferase n=1 Tax=Parablautia muri TaxID=2320879 RepID=A0A9X5BG41_9FIRM|nr:methyltransferase domain-containing protein [Parablautia muri]NBJ92512.1 class I SAM-dependent methyltransferase [Parablautia muri]
MRGGEGKRLLDKGSYSVNGGYKDLLEGCNVEYIGLDIKAGPNVDVVPENIYCWDCLEDESFDYIISGQAFEHIEFPWLTIKEIYKKLKPGGIVCITAPNGGAEHRYPYDCYRYFGNGFRALAKFAGLTVIDVTVGGVPEHSVSGEWDCAFNDVYMIATKYQEGQDLNCLPQFACERRLNEAEDWKLRYYFLTRWIAEEDRKGKIRDFLKNSKCNRVYIYGYGYIGKLLAQEIKKIEDVKLAIMDRTIENGEIDGIPCSSLRNGLKENDMTTWREKLTKPQIIPEIMDANNTLMIISVLDYNRALRLYLDTIFENIPKYYIDEII